MRIDQELSISYRQLDWWTRQGYIKATGAYPRRYSSTEKAIAKLMGRLVDVGFTPAAAAIVARYQVEHGRSRIELGDGVILRVYSAGSDHAQVA